MAKKRTFRRPKSPRVFGHPSERVESELRDELRFHLEKLTEEKVAKGMKPEQARFAALRELSGVEQIKEECRECAE